MTKFISKINKRFLALLLAMVMFFTTLSFIAITFTTQKVDAYMVPIQVAITNSEFDNTTVSGNIVSPNGWQVLNDNSSVKKGVISLNQEIFEKQMEKEYQLSFKPYSYEGIKDEQVLMINSSSVSNYCGYESSTFTLNKSSFYKISFYALTEANDERNAIGSAELIGQGFENLSERIITVSTNGNWKEYTFLVATDFSENISVNLSLYLGYSNGVKSTGAVFFDKVEVWQLGQDTFENLATLSMGNKTVNICNLNTSSPLNVINNANFETIISTENTNNTGWEILTSSDSNINNENNYYGLAYVNDSFSSSNYKLDKNPTNANISGNTKALLLNNNEASSVGFKSNEFAINKHSFYRISILVKTNIQNGTAQIRLVENNPYGASNTTFNTKTFELSVDTTSLTNTQNNDWIEYTIFVKGRNFENTTASLELWLGTKNEKATGYAFFDEIKVYEITTNAFNVGKSSSNSLTADFTTSSILDIENGAFNNIDKKDISANYPYMPLSWIQQTAKDNETLSGIINTEDTSMITKIVNPDFGKNNNILMIGNIGENKQTFTTENQFTLTSDKYYKLSFMVQTQKLNDGANAGFKLFTSNMTLKELMYIESNNEWTTYNLYIKTGKTDIKASIELSLGSKVMGTGFAFFDNVVLNQISEETYLKTLNTNEYRVNLAQEEFTNISNKSVDGIYQSYSYLPTNASNTAMAHIKSGVIDVNNASDFETYLVGIANPYMHENGTGNVLMIHSNEDCNYYYTSVNSYELTSGAYYKISVWVKTNNLSQNEENKVLSNDETYYPFGATITLTNLNQSFSGINTDSQWKEYIFYINATDNQEVQIKLSLGNEKALTKGSAFYSNVNVEEIEQNDYYDSIKPLEGENPPTNIMAIGSTKVEEEPEDKPTNEGTNFNWLVLPTLITAVALLAAVVGVAIRMFVKKHPKKITISTGLYDREKSLRKEVEQREAIRRQQEKLEKLNKQLDEVKKEIEQSKVEYKLQEKVQKQELKQKINEHKEKVANDKDRKSKLKQFKLEQKEIYKKQRLEAYNEKQKLLQAKYDALQKEIEEIYAEELRMIKEYKEYRKQVKLIKKQLRAEKRQKKHDKKTKNN